MADHDVLKSSETELASFPQILRLALRSKIEVNDADLVRTNQQTWGDRLAGVTNVAITELRYQIQRVYVPRSAIISVGDLRMRIAKSNLAKVDERQGNRVLCRICEEVVGARTLHTTEKRSCACARVTVTLTVSSSTCIRYIGYETHAGRNEQPVVKEKYARNASPTSWSKRARA